jgi:hypothetical protein
MPKGSCLCGAIRYEVEGALEGIDHCHCSRCRRSHGSPFATFGRTLKTNFRILAGAESLKDFASSDAVTRSFCEQCGSSLLFRHAAAPEFDFVAVGTLDDDPGNRPESHIFVGSKASWYEISDDLPQHDEYPPGVAD